MKQNVDIVLIGGGLANCLIALFLKTTRPEIGFVLLEQKPKLGHGGVWSFHDSDLTPTQFDLIRPLLTCSWKAQRLIFPEYERTIPTGYHSIQADVFSELLKQSLGESIQTNCNVIDFDSQSVVISDGRRYEADLVVDGRGWSAQIPVKVAYQKFVGIHYRTTVAHSMREPIIMDATVEQQDGYRFMYVLPWNKHEVLIEDTHYSSHPQVDDAHYDGQISAYATKLGLTGLTQLSREKGVLPIPLSGVVEDDMPGVVRSGLGAGLFHAATGYSVAEAVRFAEYFSGLSAFGEDSLAAIARYQKTVWDRNGFYRFLNRLLFVAARPEERYKIFQKFYRQKRSRIERFYSGCSKPGDKVRILTGKPPIPITQAMGMIFNRTGGSHA